MAQASRSVRDMEPRVHTRMMRNHFPDGNENAFSSALSGFVGTEGVYTVVAPNALTKRLWASQRQTVYRFGWINAVFNPTKVLLGDDPNCLKEDGRVREWL